MRDLRRIEMLTGWPTLQYDQTDLAGVYDVNVVEPSLSLKFAAQPDPSESSMDELSVAQLGTLKGVASLHTWTPSFSLKGQVEKDRTGLELWLPVVVAALMVGLVETFLGQWFSRSK